MVDTTGAAEQAPLLSSGSALTDVPHVEFPSSEERQSRAAILERWVSEGPKGLERVYGVIEIPADFDALTKRSRILLRAGNNRRSRAAIIGAQEQTVLSGSIADHYLRRAERFRPSLEHEDRLLVEVAR